MRAYGIDLGTTYSCIAYIDARGRPVIAKNRLGEETTPSVVYFESPENVVVGRAAKSTALLHPDLVVSQVKREMGQEVWWEWHGKRETPETISALILRELAAAAGKRTGEDVRDVVITVPAYFGLAEREATRRAGQIAGLNVLQLVPEPVAAALHYQALTPEDRTILIFDLGGGTFDTTVIRLQGSDINVICTDGNHRLGGASWDAKLQDYLLDEFVAAHPDQADPRADEEFLQGLAMDVEQLKRELTGVQTRQFTMRFGEDVSQIEVTRDLFESLTSELLEETLTITQRTIAVAKARYVDHFDDVLLVGGASKMPAVTRLLKERFGFEAQLHDPDLAVAKGAALLAIIESVKFSLQDESASSAPEVEQVAHTFGLTTEQVRDLARKRVTTVVPRAFGTRVIDASDPTLKRTYVDHVLHANDPLPIEVGPNRYTTAYDNQTGVEVGIYEQAGAVESEELEHNTRIGGSVIDGLPPLPRDSPIDITYAMDAMGTLRVHAMEISTGKDLRIELKIGSMDKAQVDEARRAQARYSVGE